MPLHPLALCPCLLTAQISQHVLLSRAMPNLPQLYIDFFFFPPAASYLKQMHKPAIPLAYNSLFLTNFVLHAVNI